VSVRFAVVGCGNAARQLHLPALRAEGAEVTAFASRSRTSAEALRDEWGGGAVSERWDEAIGRDDVDAVVVAVPNALHHDIAIAAANAGKHVLVDKPMACTTEDADEMIAAARANQVWLVPFHNTRFVAPFVAAQRFVTDGRLGAVTGFRAAFGHAGPQEWAPQADWFFDRTRSGGGCLIDLGVHVIDLLRAVTGDEIVAVSALLNGCRGDVEADAQLLARLRGGATGTIHASWSSPSGPDHQLTVIGTEGTLHLDSRTPLTFLDGDGGRERLRVPETTSSPLAELLAAIAGERSPSITAADGRAAVAVVQAAYRSAADASALTEVA
jgi:UDP-N-acetylglucosamine 3-dehydrogenase